MDDRLTFKELSPSNTLKSSEDDLKESVRDGLLLSEAYNRSLPCRFFYDAKGSQLFEQITELEEYYPTRCEYEILQNHAKELVEALSSSPQTTQGNHCSKS